MHWKLILILAYLLTWILIPHILLKNRSPISTLCWCWAIVLFPFFGPLAYGLLGSDRMAKKHLRKREEISAPRSGMEKECSAEPEAESLIARCGERDRQLIGLLGRINLAPTSQVESARLLVDTTRFYPALIEAIEEAKHHAHAQFFVFHNDAYGRKILAALTRASQRGVETRLLLDQIGCSDTKDEMFTEYQAAGGHFAWFRTISPFKNRWVVNLRNHRKIQVIDGRVGFIGGMNVGREYAGEDPKLGSWRDVQIELRGAAVAAMQQVFAEDWLYATDLKLEGERYYPEYGEARDLVQIMSDGPDVREDPIQMSMVALLSSARKRLWVTAGYFVPNEPLLTALKMAAARGIDVRLLISEKSDHPWLVQVGRSYYEELLEFGVRIFEYSKGMNHSKVALCDDHWSMVGSANFDIRSMHLNFEANALIRSEEIARELEKVLTDDLENDSDEIDLAEFRRRPFSQRVRESLLRPLAPLL